MQTAVLEVGQSPVSTEVSFSCSSAFIRNASFIKLALALVVERHFSLEEGGQ